MQARRSGWLLVCHRLLPTVLFSIVVILVSGLSVWAQGNYRAQLRGVVSDATGAVVPNATVTIRNIGTNISSAAHTDDKGSYYFTGLLPTTYDVKAEASGFRSAERTGVVLAVDQGDSTATYLRLRDLDGALRDLAANARDFHSTMADLRRDQDLAPERFLSYKHLLIDYLQQFLEDLFRYRAQIAAQ